MSEADTVKLLREARDIMAEADRRVAWESLGLGNEFAERFEACVARIDAALSASSEDGWQDIASELDRLTLENGPIVIDKYGEELAWRPLDYGTWTTFAPPQGRQQ